MPPETTPPKTGIALETPFAKVAFVNFAPKQLIFFQYWEEKRFCQSFCGRRFSA